MAASVSPLMPSAQKAPILSSAVLGMIAFIFTEMMIFSAFISSFVIVKSSFTNWPPMGQPRLPVYATAVNSLFLLASGWLLNKTYRYFVKEQGTARVKRLFLLSLLLGALFVLLQGVEWIRLIGFGLTLTSSVYGSFFYLIVGGHALHVLGAVVTLTVMYRRLLRDSLSKDTFAAILAFWFFVVGLWPVLYGLVYL